ncbi:hypothetical protein D6029_10505 [Buttiauxella izardii]|uniref:Uncharacterized protein n=1 Tax=Buttiauxella izardii TaxID=82991 RepID=A0A3A5JR85_9ENTR|nr:hypothetical protein D6029_10505 [Buttiauxella izardii]
MPSEFSASKLQGNIVFKKCILILTVVLVGCANPEDETIKALNTINFQPVTTSPAESQNPVELKSLHNKNKQTIANLTANIKSARVDNLRSVDVFDNRYGINTVFQALTKLEEINELNDIYLHDENKNGLMQISSLLKPISDTTS